MESLDALLNVFQYTCRLCRRYLTPYHAHDGTLDILRQLIEHRPEVGTCTTEQGVRQQVLDELTRCGLVLKQRLGLGVVDVAALVKPAHGLLGI